MTRSLSLFALSAAAALAVGQASAANIVVVDFGTSSVGGTEYVEDDLRVTHQGTFGALIIQAESLPEENREGSDGGAFIYISKGGNELIITQDQNEPFSLLSVRMSSQNSNSPIITFTGTPFGGGPVIVENITFNQFGFETFNLSTMNNLQSLLIQPTGGASGAQPDAVIDSLTFDVVPEPTSLAMLGLGGLIVCRPRRNTIFVTH